MTSLLGMGGDIQIYPQETPTLGVFLITRTNCNYFDFMKMFGFFKKLGTKYLDFIVRR